MSPRLIPTHEVRKTLYARARASVLSLLFAYGQSSRGVATPIRDTPRDVLSIRKSNEEYFFFQKRFVRAVKSSVKLAFLWLKNN